MLVAVPLAARGTRVTSLPAAVGLGFVHRLQLLHRAGVRARARPDGRAAAAHRRLDVERRLRPDRRATTCSAATDRRPALRAPARAPPGPVVSGRPSSTFMHCTACPAAPLPEVVDRRHDDRAARGLVPVPADGAAVGAAHLAQLGRLARRAARRTARRRRRREQLLEPRRLRPSSRDVHRAEDAAAHRQEVRHEDARGAARPRARSSWSISGRCRCPPTRTGRKFSFTSAKSCSTFGAAARAGRARLGVDDDRLADEPRARERHQAEQRAGRDSSPGTATSRALPQRLAVELGNAVDRLGEQLGRGMRSPYQRA